MFTYLVIFLEKDALLANFQKCFAKGFMRTWKHVLCANFVKFGRPKSLKSCVIYLTKKNKKSARAPALASARIAPKICQGQLQTIYSEYPNFHPNLFTSGGVIAGRVNDVETRHKMFPILGEAYSPSKNNGYSLK